MTHNRQSAINIHAKRALRESAMTPLAAPAASAPGIDVSRHNGLIHWQRVKRLGIQFAYIRATMGAQGHDSQFDANWQGAQSAGLPFLGAYHYFTSDQSGDSQAKNFISSFSGVGNLPPVVDVEPRYNEILNDAQRQAFSAQLRLWLEIVQREAEIHPAIYTRFSAWPAMTTEPMWARDYPLWVAHYTDDLAPRLPAPWTDYLIWQWTDKGRFYGIAGNVDLNLWRSDARRAGPGGGE